MTDIRTSVIFTDQSSISGKVIDGNNNDIHIKRGATIDRPLTSTVGDQYYDTTLNILYNYKDSGWAKVSQDPAPQIASISPTTAGTIGAVVTINGASFKSGAVVQFIGTDGTAYNSPVVTFVADSQITATTPELPVIKEPYDVKVINNDNQYAILVDCLDAGSTPTWVTTSGTIANITEQTALSVSVSATDPDGASIIYSSSNKPSWVTLNSSTGALTGTAPNISVDTTYSFDIVASDGVNTSSRSFSIVSTLYKENIFRPTSIYGDARSVFSWSTSAILSEAGSVSSVADGVDSINAANWVAEGYQHQLQNNDGYIQVDLGSGRSFTPIKTAVIGYPSGGSHWCNNNYIKGSNDGTNWTTLVTWSTHPGASSNGGSDTTSGYLHYLASPLNNYKTSYVSANLNTLGITISGSSAYRYFRLGGTGWTVSNGYQLVMDWIFYGIPA